MAKKEAAKAKKQKTTKSDQIIASLGRADGATLTELTKVSGWQSHSVRGFLAGALKRKGLVVTSSKEDGKDRRYSLKGTA